MEKSPYNYNPVYYFNVLLNTYITKKIDKIKLSLYAIGDKLDIKILIGVLQTENFTVISNYSTKQSDNKHYSMFYELLFYNRIKIYLFYLPKKPYYPDYSLVIHDPCCFDCLQLNRVFSKLLGFKQNINQIEIATDFHDNIDFWDTILNKHLWIKWIKTNKGNKRNKDNRKLFNKFETTLYNGNTRATARSSRVYPKIENGKRFLRFEIVLNNGKYLNPFKTLEAMLNINELNINELFCLKSVKTDKVFDHLHNNKHFNNKYKKYKKCTANLARGVCINTLWQLSQSNNVQAFAKRLKEKKRIFDSSNVSSQFFYTIPEDEILKDRLGAIAITGFPN